jgi:hypothetical protein
VSGHEGKNAVNETANTNDMRDPSEIISSDLTSSLVLSKLHNYAAFFSLMVFCSDCSVSPV